MTEAELPGDLTVSSASDLPPIAADAEDLRVIKAALGDAAGTGAALWLSYLFAAFYLAVAAGAVTHADLFFENPVKLPFLSIELPLLAFFFVAPILFLVVHTYTLAHLVMLTGKVKRFNEALRKQIDGNSSLTENEAKQRAAIRAGLQWQLPSNIFVQFLAGPEPTNLRERAFRRLLLAIAFVTLAIAPVLLLLLIQVQFLPFHNHLVTWSHRLVLGLDLIVMWWLWSMIAPTRELPIQRWESKVWTGFAAFLTAFAIVFSWIIATFPGEWHEAFLQQISRPVFVAALHDWIFESAIDRSTGRRLHFFSSTLVLPGLNIYEGVKIDDPKKAEWRDYVFRAHNRDLKGAMLDLASLPKVDFEGAQLQGASLRGTQLQGASLLNAKLQGASLFMANLQGASLVNADLQGAYLFQARLQFAWLDNARLQGASLSGAELQAASLKGAQLQGASLENAQLQGASLQLATLRATNLSRALLWRTNVGTSKQSQAVSITAIELPDERLNGLDFWAPIWRDSSGNVQRWGDENYQHLLKAIELFPPGEMHDDAQTRVERLDCARPIQGLVSCDPSAPWPDNANDWRNSLLDARVNESDYSSTLLAELKRLVCNAGGDDIYILRGIIENHRLHDPDVSASDIADLSKSVTDINCPISTSIGPDHQELLLRFAKSAQS